MPKEHPILFSAPMVRAIFAGTKTQTRRVMKPQPEYFKEQPHWRWPHKVFGNFAVASGDSPGYFGKYAVGERLWVRETWARSYNSLAAEAAGPVLGSSFVGPAYVYRADAVNPGKGWNPSIFMPRNASRITLEITDVRIEQLWDITESDAIAEGAPCIDNPDYDPDDAGDDEPQTYRAGFADLWVKINGQESWDENPWVWVVTFQRVEGAAK